MDVKALALDQKIENRYGAQEPDNSVRLRVCGDSLGKHRLLAPTIIESLESNDEINYPIVAHIEGNKLAFAN